MQKPLMTPVEKQEFKQMKDDIEKLVAAQGQNSDKLDKLLIALKGDDLGNKGLLKEYEETSDHVKTLMEERTRNNLYITIIRWLIGIIAVGIIGFLIDTIFNKKPIIIYQQPPPVEQKQTVK